VFAFRLVFGNARAVLRQMTFLYPCVLYFSTKVLVVRSLPERTKHLHTLCRAPYSTCDQNVQSSSALLATLSVAVPEAGKGYSVLQRVRGILASEPSRHFHKAFIKSWPRMLATSIRRFGTQFISRNARKFSSVPTEGSSSGSAEIWDWVPPATAKIQPLNDIKNYVLPIIEG